MQIIAIANQKGGTGKSTTAAALAQATAAAGEKALAIDIDPQANLSYILGAEMNRGASFDLLEGSPPARLIQKTAGGPDIIPASLDLAAVTSSTGSAKRLQAALMPIKRAYSLIIVDTPPTAGELQYNALQAATGLIIPLRADILSLQGLYQIADTAAQIKKSNPALKITGILITQHNDRSTIARQMKENIIATARQMAIPYLGAIREGVAIREAQALQENLFQYAPKSKPALDYMEIYRKIMEV